MKLILSERELEVIKQKEYKRGWYECDMAHAKSHDDAFKYLYPELEGEIQKFNKPSLATAEFRHEHGFEQESCQEELKKAICCGKEWIYIKTSLSVAKCHLCGKPVEQERCQHESDGNFYVNEKMHNTLPIGLSFDELRGKGVRNKCSKCGEFY